MDTIGTEYYSVPDPTPPTVPAFRRACGRLPDAGFPCVSERTVFSIRSHTRAAFFFFLSHEVCVSTTLHLAGQKRTVWTCHDVNAT